MAFPRGGGGAEPHGEARPPGTEERVSSCYHSSSSNVSMSSTSSDEEDAAAHERRIPAAVFERDTSASRSAKDWSMISTDSVFALQVAPSCDFTGFFLAHPELMDISTPPRDSAAGDGAGAGEVVLAPHFESFPDLDDAILMRNGNYSFAFPNLIEDKRHNSKKAHVHAHHEQPASPPAMPTMTAAVTADEAPATTETSSKPEVAPAKAPAKCCLLSCFPCCCP